MVTAIGLFTDMAVEKMPSLLESDREILQLLAEEPRQTPSMLLKTMDTTDSQQYVQNRLQHLRENDLVTRPGRGLYELTAIGERAVSNLPLYTDDRFEFWRVVNEE